MMIRCPSGANHAGGRELGSVGGLPHTHVLAGKRPDGRVVVRAVASRGEDRVGISNVFASRSGRAGTRRS